MSIVTELMSYVQFKYTVLLACDKRTCIRVSSDYCLCNVCYNVALKYC